MNILKNLLGYTPSIALENEISPEAQAKADRLAYHLRHVRNGPVTYGKRTSDARRAKIDQAAFERKAKKRHRKAFHTKQFEKAKLRGRLQVATQIPYADPRFRPELELQINAIDSLIQEFGGPDFEMSTEGVDKVIETATVSYNERFERR